MLYFPVIVLVDGLHNQLHQERAFVTQFTEIDIHPGMAEVRRVLILQEVLHFDVQHFRFVCVFRIRGIKLPSSQITEKFVSPGKPSVVALTLTTFFRPVRFSGNDVVTA